MSIHGEVIWVTGASSGIGAALAQQLARQRNRVIASARNTAALYAMAAAAPSCDVLPFDVTAKEQIDTVRRRLATLAPRIDRVIFNAGTCEYLDIDTPDWSLPERVMTTNYFGMINSLAACFDLLKRAPRPHIVAIGSQAIRAPFPRASAYGASKAAIDYFLQSLRLDVAHLDIDITHVLPGFVDTPLTRKNDFPMPFLLSADAAARRIVAALEKRPFEYAFPRRLSAALWLARRSPRVWQYLMRKNPPQTSAERTESID